MARSASAHAAGSTTVRYRTGFGPGGRERRKGGKCTLLLRWTNEVKVKESFGTFPGFGGGKEGKEGPHSQQRCGLRYGDHPKGEALRCSRGIRLLERAKGGRLRHSPRDETQTSPDSGRDAFPGDPVSRFSVSRRGEVPGGGRREGGERSYGRVMLTFYPDSGADSNRDTVMDVTLNPRGTRVLQSGTAR